MAPYRVDGPSEATRQLLALFVVLGMVIVALLVMAGLLLVDYLLWQITFPEPGENLGTLLLSVLAPFVLMVWVMGYLLLWWLRGVLRGLLDRPSAKPRRLLVPFVVLSMVVVALPILASLLMVGYVLWGKLLQAFGGSTIRFLLYLSPFNLTVWLVGVLEVWVEGGLLLWWLRGILREPRD